MNKENLPQSILISQQLDFDTLMSSHLTKSFLALINSSRTAATSSASRVASIKCASALASALRRLSMAELSLDDRVDTA